MPVLIKGTIDATGFPSKRAFRRAMEVGHLAQGEHWHKNILKLHFRRDSRQRYGYRPRTATYERRKRYGRGHRGRAKYQGMVDLVFTGDLEQAVRNFATIRAFPSRVTIVMNGPSYLRINYRPGRPHLSNEIIATTGDEERDLAAVLDRVVTKEMNQNTERLKLE